MLGSGRGQYGDRPGPCMVSVLPGVALEGVALEGEKMMKECNVCCSYGTGPGERPLNECCPRCWGPLRVLTEIAPVPPYLLWPARRFDSNGNLVQW